MRRFVLALSPLVLGLGIACAEPDLEDGQTSDNAGGTSASGASGASGTSGANGGKSGAAGTATAGTAGSAGAAGSGAAGTAGAAGSGTAGTGTAGTGTAGTGTAGTGAAGMGAAGTGTAGTGTAGTGTAGTGTAGTGTAGTGSAGTGTAGAPTGKIVSIAAGKRHTCAVTSDGGALCWGSNETEQVGPSSETCDVELGPSGPEPLPCVRKPTSLAGATGALSISAGDGHTCARTATGVLCWGDDTSGQLGDGKAGGTRGAAMPVVQLGAVTALGAGAISTCALDAQGGVSCWGGNANGQLGNGTMQPSATPTAALLSPVTATSLAVGAYHVCIRIPSGGVQCWGQNLYGQLGDGSKSDFPAPVTVQSLSSVTSLCAGGWHTCAVSGGKVLCWGSNSEGQLGSGTPGFGNDVGKPTEVPGLSGVEEIVCGREHTCARIGAAIQCWGANDRGELARGTMGASTVTPAAVAGTSAVTLAAGGGSHTCVLDGGIAKCAGWNAFGQLGDGGTTDTGALAPVAY